MVINQIWEQNNPDIVGVPEAFDLFGTSLAVGDFNRDGRDDLGIGVPREDVGSVTDAGAANVLYGGSSGLTASGNQIWTQETFGVKGIEEEFDRFGSSLASADFNGDNRADLAIGVRGESIGSIQAAGAVNVLYSSSAGVDTPGDQIWEQNTSGVEGVAEINDSFGNSLGTGDFDGDGFDDLAIGVIGEDVGNLAGAGAVNVLYGSISGLTAIGNQIWDQNTPGVRGVAETGDSFGISMVSGDFDGDGYDDLSIGAHLESIGSIASAGAVNVLYGSTNGLTASGDQIWHQNSSDFFGPILGGSEVGDFFGISQAAGDFDGDGFDDLAIGASGENSSSGAVNVLYGSSSGLRSIGNQFWSQNSSGIAGVEETDDRFGTSLGVGDFNGDGFADLAIGVPGEDIGNISDAGAVNVIYGSLGSGLNNSNNQIWHQNTSGIEGIAEAGDLFGSSFGVGDLNGDGFDDLAIGAPGEDSGNISSSGAVNVLYGSANGLTAGIG